jgi:signal transduction histidine kinase/CheY-like chemotaxis protein
MKNQIKGIKIKFALFFLVFVTAMFSLIAMTSVQQTRQLTQTMISIVGVPILNRVSFYIDGDKFETLARTLDENDPFFIETQEVFRQLRYESQVFFLYAMAPYDGDIHMFIFDGEDPKSEFFSPLGEKEDVSDYDDALLMVYKTGETQFVPIVHYSEWGHLVSAYMPIINSRGDVVGIIGVDFDGTGIQNAIMSSLRTYIIFAVAFIVVGFLIYSFLLKDIVKQNAELRIASRTKSEFLATMSHEIRTPLNAILGITQIQMQDEALPQNQATALEKINTSGNILLKIINDILDMSKIETGNLELNPAKYETPSLITDTVQINIVRIGSKPVKFLLAVDENLPVHLYGDDLRIKQILNNLLSNAIKYTDEGYVKLTLSHVSDGGNVLLRFVVEDTGQGMRPEDRENLFTEYKRFDAKANRSKEGTGLGLAIAKKLTDMMNGTIHVESEPGKGSTFTVEIWQILADSKKIGPETAQKLNNFSFIEELNSVKYRITHELMPYGNVLVVDDVETNLYVAEGLMAPYKINVETAVNGFAALDKINSGKRYDIVFMDHMMPKMDGIETTKILRESGYTGTIVALTANALVGNDELFLQNGFDAFLAKPIDIRQLNHILNTFIRNRYPNEAKKYRPEVFVGQSVISPNVLRVFYNEAKKTVVTLRETLTNADITLFTITTHAMKSALANVGEQEASELAGKLEEAGLVNDLDFIREFTEPFIRQLEIIIQKYEPTEDSYSEDYLEDTAYLNEQFESIKTACKTYDIITALAVLDELDKKTWNLQTVKNLEKIRDELQLNSDFDEVVSIIETISVQHI